VNGFELRVCDGGLDQGRQGFLIAESNEIVKQESQFIDWRWNEVSATRVVVVPAYPVLPDPQLPGGDSRVSGKKESVDIQETVEIDAFGERCVFDGELHCIYIGKDLCGF
jgi:hypothetical protein